jgi:CRP-like cAMP-binding protein
MNLGFMYELILKNISRYISLTEEEIADFTSILQLKKLRKRQYLLQAGDYCRYECFVNKGCLRQYYVSDKGQEHILSFAVEDWWLSDMYGLITGNPSLTNIEAVEDSEVLMIERTTWDDMLLRIPKFERFFRIILQRSLITQQLRIIENISHTAEERYERFVERYPLLEQRVPQRQIASYLGITPESLSRIRKQRTEGKKS